MILICRDHGTVNLMWTLLQPRIYTFAIDLHQIKDQTFITSLKNSTSFLVMKGMGMSLVESPSFVSEGLPRPGFFTEGHVSMQPQKITPNTVLHTLRRCQHERGCLGRNSTQLQHTSGFNKKQISCLSLLIPGQRLSLVVEFSPHGSNWSFLSKS